MLKSKKITLGNVAGVASAGSVLRYGSMLSSVPFIGGPTVAAGVLLCSFKVFVEVSDVVDETATDLGMDPTIFDWNKSQQ